RRIRRLLVANRGELVVRIATTCRSLGIQTLALATIDQRDAWWTRAADEVIALESDYLDEADIVVAAIAAGADAVHPGYGFLAERPSFAEAVIAAGLIWVGPPPAAMRALGDKAAARRLAVSVGIPVLPGYDGRGQSDAILRREAGRTGYPILLKPSAGGGGKGMHVVRSAADLREALAVARREAQTAFGDDRLILERYLDRPRHVEVQVLLDGHGRGIHLGERDCSLQRRHQKVIEEAPAPGVAPGLRGTLGEAALRLAQAAGYVGAGTAEFLLTDDGTFVFLEMNARLQVEHPVTEAVTGIDLVAEQLRIAAGEPLRLTQQAVVLTGHAIEARLYAEDPWSGFLPATGRVLDVRWPETQGLRVDAGIGAGDAIGTRYDPLLAKLIVLAPDRATALAVLAETLDETRVLGVTTNRSFLAWLLRLAAVVSGAARTDTIETRWHPRPELPESAWATAASTLGDEQIAAERSAPSSVGRGFRLNGPRRLAIELDGERRTVELMARASWPGIEDGTSASPRGVTSDPDDVRVDSDAVVVDVDGRSMRARLAPPPSVDSAIRAAHHGTGIAATIAAPMPGIVTAVRVREGESVEAHQVLLVLEAMKMENAITAPADGTIERVLARPGQAVQRGDVLVELDG
ncbi:MAG TPA: biotin carboxylase N-terminal domain-containing protein, partial [Candidatus Saccharimonadia bacterium]|nr:biotin carboxylase N-terminal domain-containing protein [Candidatus Saccharimonadia bacterium]